jgi:hypothetical protein
MVYLDHGGPLASPGRHPIPSWHPLAVTPAPVVAVAPRCNSEIRLRRGGDQTGGLGRLARLSCPARAGEAV